MAALKCQSSVTHAFRIRFWVIGFDCNWNLHHTLVRLRQPVKLHFTKGLIRHTHSQLSQESIKNESY